MNIRQAVNKPLKILSGLHALTFSKYPYAALRLFLLLVIYSFFRAAFYLFNIDIFHDIGTDELIAIFLGGIRFDLSGLLYLNIIYFTFILLPFYFVHKPVWQKVSGIFFIIVNITGFLANSIDIVYYPFTLRRTTGQVFREFKNEEGLLSVFLNGMADFWPITLFFVIISFLFVFSVKHIRLKKSELSGKHFYLIHSILLPVILFLMINGIRGGFGRSSRPIAIEDAGQYVNRPAQIAMVINTPFSIIRTLGQEKLSIINDFETEHDMQEYFTPIRLSNPVRSFAAKNIVIIILESFSKELSGRLNPDMQNGDYQGYIPFIDSLMGESLNFTNAYASGKKSIDAIPSIVAGIPYLKTHFAISNYSTNKVHGLGYHLQKNGYSLSFFHGAPNGSMGFNSIMKMFGFKKYFGKNEFNDDSFYDGTWGIYDEEFLRYFAHELNNMQQPFASVFFSLSSHHPWDVPERYGDTFDGGPKKMFRTFRYTDWAVRQFFKTVSQMPWYKNTLFILTADHAAYIYYQEYKNTIGAFAIPLFFFTPDGSLKGEDKRVASQLDVFPTVLDYIGLKTEYFSFGNSLLDSASERFATFYSQGSYYLLKDSLALQLTANKVTGLYNYLNDRELSNNLSTNMPRQKKYLELKLRAIRQQYINRMITDRMH